MTRERLKCCRALGQACRKDWKILRLRTGTAARGKELPEPDFQQRWQEVSAQLDKLIRMLLEVEEAMEPLSVRERVVLRAYYIEGLTWKQVCVRMNCGEAQIYRIHASALKKLQQAEKTAAESQDSAAAVNHRDELISDRTGD